MDRKPLKKRTLAWIAICGVCLLFLAVVTAPDPRNNLHSQTPVIAEATH